MESNNRNIKSKIQRIGGHLHRIITITDNTGKVVQTFISPFMVEFRPRDILQIIVGATILAIPVGLTEETWILGKELPMINVLLLCCISIVFIALFVYFNFYRFHLKSNVSKYIKRVLATYGLSLITVGILLTIINKCPWGADNLLAIKRVIITTFPCSMAATISDTMK